MFLFPLVIKPWSGSVFAKYDRIKELRLVFSRGQDLQAKRDELRSSLNVVPAAQQQLVRDAILEYSPGNVALFLLELDELVKRKSGLPFDTKYDVGVAVKEGDTDVFILPVSFTFGEISYTTLRQFVLSLQRWEKGVRIQSMSVGLPANEDLVERGFVRATVSVEALFSASPVVETADTTL